MVVRIKCNMHIKYLSNVKHSVPDKSCNPIIISNVKKKKSRKWSLTKQKLYFRPDF